MLNGLLLARHGGAARRPNPGLRLALRAICTLAIETSCDDTCVAILTKGRQDGAIRPPTSAEPLAKLLFNEKITADNTAYQGIHPIESLTSHYANLSKLIAKSLRFLPAPDENQKQANQNIYIGESGAPKLRPDFISVTRGPGMRSNLSVGLDTAKGLAVAWGIPLVAVHHMQAHALTPRLAMAINKLRAHEQFDSNNVQIEPKFPFLTVLVSGGHTLLLHSKGLTEHTVLATTADIAIGAALDKIGRIVLPKEKLDMIGDTAFAKHLSEYAFPSPDHYSAYGVPARRGDEVHKPPNQYGWSVQAPFAEKKDMTFSFSGIASRIESLFAERSEYSEPTGHQMAEAERRLLAQTALGTAFEHLGSRTIIGLENMKKEGIEISTLVVSGGVAANDFLRVFFRNFLDARGFEDVQLVFPPQDLCTDNAAMIAWAGIEMFEAGFRSDLGCTPLNKWSMDSESEDGGVAGAEGWATIRKRAALDDSGKQGLEESIVQKRLTKLKKRFEVHGKPLIQDYETHMSGMILEQLVENGRSKSLKQGLEDGELQKINTQVDRDDRDNERGNTTKRHLPIEEEGIKEDIHIQELWSDDPWQPPIRDRSG